MRPCTRAFTAYQELLSCAHCMADLRVRMVYMMQSSSCRAGLGCVVRWSSTQAAVQASKHVASTAGLEDINGTITCIQVS